MTRGEELADAKPVSDRRITSAFRRFVAAWLPGLALCIGLTAVSFWASGRLHVPGMLIVLVLGIALRAADPAWLRACDGGIRFASKDGLHIGIALLGLKLSLGGIQQLGVSVVALVLATLCATILAGIGIGRWFRLPKDTSAIFATSVAICGASAALAASTVPPSRAGLERDTGTVVAVVSLLGSAVMLLYPWLAHQLAYDSHQTAVLLGAAIHDVAQVAGAGLSVSPLVGVEAVAVKMIRVVSLLPVVMSLGLLFRRTSRGATASSKRAVLPWFLVGFAVLAVLANSGVMPPAVARMGAGAATWLLAAAVAAIGLHTSVAELRGISPRLCLAIAAQSAFQLLCVVSLIHMLGRGHLPGRW